VRTTLIHVVMAMVLCADADAARTRDRQFLMGSTNEPNAPAVRYYAVQGNGSGAPGAAPLSRAVPWEEGRFSSLLCRSAVEASCSGQWELGGVWLEVCAAPTAARSRRS
jgi:hypothetical protein